MMGFSVSWKTQSLSSSSTVSFCITSSIPETTEQWRSFRSCSRDTTPSLRKSSSLLLFSMPSCNYSTRLMLSFKSESRRWLRFLSVHKVSPSSKWRPGARKPRICWVKWLFSSWVDSFGPTLSALLWRTNKRAWKKIRNQVAVRNLSRCSISRNT